MHYYLSMAKVPLSLMIALSALLGFVLQAKGLVFDSFFCFVAVFLLATGCATLNNIQDRKYDSQLTRTRNRPLVIGKMTPATAVIQAGILLGLGLFALKFFAKEGTNLAFLGGLGSVFLYNGIYTPLKHRSVLAIIPGAICGMLPLLLGWFMAGTETPGPELVAGMILVGIWQFPHFWLVLLYHQSDYEASDCFSMLSLFSPWQLRRILLSWVLSFAVISLLLPLFGVVQSAVAVSMLILNAFVLSAFFIYSCLQKNNPQVKLYHQLFLHLNSALLLVMILIIGSNI